MPAAIRRLSVLWVLSWFASAAPAQAEDAAWAGLREQIDRRLAPLARQGVAYGVRIIALPSGQVVYSVNAEGIETPVPGGGETAVRLLAPASNMKLITTAAALDRFGKDHEFRTVLGLRGADLVVVGDGDPSFGDTAVDGVKSTTAEFAKWAAALKAKGVTAISGALIVDDTIFDNDLTAPGWPRDQLNEWFCAPVCGLNFNTNCADVFVAPNKAGGPPTVRAAPANDWLRIVNQTRAGGSANVVGLTHGRGDNEIIVRGTVARADTVGLNVTVRDPALFFGHCLLKTLAENGITVAGGVTRGRVRTTEGALPADLNVVAVKATPLPVVLARCNKRSQNLYAESLFKSLGAAWRGADGNGAAAQGTWATGKLAVARFLGKLHLPDDSHDIVDGSGLSRDNGVSPLLVTEVLRHMHGHPQFETYRDSLAVSGTDGTLVKRMRDPALKGHVLAKTGFIRGVSGLSGYVRAGGQWFAFSMLFNDIKGTTTPFKELEDDICRDVMRFGAAAEGAGERRK